MAPTIDHFRLPLPDLVALWEKKYTPKTKRRFDIMKVKVNRKCRACGRTTLLNRHHKGFESLFARARPDLYAKRYIEFRPRDVVILCEYCHSECHSWLVGVKYEVTDIVYGRHHDPGCRVLLTKRQCELYRRSMIRLTNLWIKEYIRHDK